MIVVGPTERLAALQAHHNAACLIECLDGCSCPCHHAAPTAMASHPPASPLPVPPRGGASSEPVPAKERASTPAPQTTGPEHNLGDRSLTTTERTCDEHGHRS